MSKSTEYLRLLETLHGYARDLNLLQYENINFYILNIISVLKESF